MTSAAAGWYQDPEDPGRLRYFDGSGWTTEVRALPESPTHDVRGAEGSQAWASPSGPAPPGWYADPATGAQRYFDGSTWAGEGGTIGTGATPLPRLGGLIGMLAGLAALAIVGGLTTWLPAFNSTLDDFDAQAFSLWDLRDFSGSPLSELAYWLLGAGVAGLGLAAVGCVLVAVRRVPAGAAVGSAAGLAGLALASVPVRTYIEYRELQDQGGGDAGVKLGIAFYAQIPIAIAMVTLAVLVLVGMGRSRARG